MTIGKAKRRHRGRLKTVMKNAVRAGVVAKRAARGPAHRAPQMSKEQKAKVKNKARRDTDRARDRKFRIAGKICMWVARRPELRSQPIRTEEASGGAATTLEEVIGVWTAMLEASKRDYEGQMEALEDARIAGRKAFDELLSPYFRALGEATYDSKCCFRECYGGVARRSSASSNETAGVVPLPCVRLRSHGRDIPCTPAMEQAFPQNEHM